MPHWSAVRVLHRASGPTDVTATRYRNSARSAIARPALVRSTQSNSLPVLDIIQSLQSAQSAVQRTCISGLRMILGERTNHETGPRMAGLHNQLEAGETLTNCGRISRLAGQVA
jgi:hypothetical protein